MGVILTGSVSRMRWEDRDDIRKGSEGGREGGREGGQGRT